MSTYDLVTPNVWIISDTHWGEPRMRDRPRDHELLMLENWHKLVEQDEVIIHLGDLVTGRALDAFSMCKHLPGNKFLLRGNLDFHEDRWYERAGFTVIGRDPFISTEVETNQKICFSHEPAPNGDWDINIHGHVHNNPLFQRHARHEDRRNACVEVINFTPIRLRDILKPAHGPVPIPGPEEDDET